jgi:hypothetical protein
MWFIRWVVRTLYCNTRIVTKSKQKTRTPYRGHIKDYGPKHDEGDTKKGHIFTIFRYGGYSCDRDAVHRGWRITIGRTGWVRGVETCRGNSLWCVTLHSTLAPPRTLSLSLTSHKNVVIL